MSAATQHAPAVRSTRPRARHRALVWFLAPFVVTCLVLRVCFPPDPGHAWHPTLTAKLNHLQTTHRHYDVALVGDSTRSTSPLRSRSS